MNMLEKLIVLLQRLLLKLIRRKYKIGNDWVNNSYVTLLLKQTIGCKVKILDLYYRVVDLETWKKIIQSDTLNLTKKWHKDVFDCDDFAIVFKAHVAEFYEINSVGVAIGRVYDANTLEFIGYHAYNVIIVRDDDCNVYLYEPQTDGLAKADKRTKLGNRIYETEWVLI